MFQRNFDGNGEDRPSFNRKHSSWQLVSIVESMRFPGNKFAAPSTKEIESCAVGTSGLDHGEQSRTGFDPSTLKFWHANTFQSSMEYCECQNVKLGIYPFTNTGFFQIESAVSQLKRRVHFTVGKNEDRKDVCSNSLRIRRT